MEYVKYVDPRALGNSCYLTNDHVNLRKMNVTPLVKYLPTILVRIRVMSLVCSTTAFIPDRYYCAETIFFYMVTKFGVWLLCAWEIFSDRFCGKKFQIIGEKYVPFWINQRRCSQSISFGRNLSIARLSFHDPSETTRNGNSNLLWRRYRQQEYSE